MNDVFMGTIQIFPYGAPIPNGWAPCNGQLLSIQANQALFSLLGTTYGGDGVTSFALPNLQGQFMMGTSKDIAPGATGGEATHTLQTTEIPAHTHDFVGSSATAASFTPLGNFPADTGNAKPYTTPATVYFGTGSSFNLGGAAHENMPPYVVMNICIAVQGIFPSRN